MMFSCTRYHVNTMLPIATPNHPPRPATNNLDSLPLKHMDGKFPLKALRQESGDADVGATVRSRAVLDADGVGAVVSVGEESNARVFSCHKSCHLPKDAC